MATERREVPEAPTGVLATNGVYTIYGNKTVGITSILDQRTDQQHPFALNLKYYTVCRGEWMTVFCKSTHLPPFAVLQRRRLPL